MEHSSSDRVAEAILAEESGEFVRAVLQATYDDKPSSEARAEAVQTAAMALRWIEVHDRIGYNWDKARQRDDSEVSS